MAKSMLRGVVGMRTPKRSKLDPLDEIAAAFDEGMDRIDGLEKEVGQMASMAAVRSIQDEMRKYAEARDKEQNDALTERMDLINGNLRQGIMADVSKLLQENLSHWVEHSLQPLVDEIVTEREKAAQAQRDLEWQRIKGRLQTAGSLIILLTAIVTFYFAFQGNAGPREAHQLNKVGDAITGFQ